MTKLYECDRCGDQYDGDPGARLDVDPKRARRMPGKRDLQVQFEDGGLAMLPGLELHVCPECLPELIKSQFRDVDTNE